MTHVKVSNKAHKNKSGSPHGLTPINCEVKPGHMGALPERLRKVFQGRSPEESGTPSDKNIVCAKWGQPMPPKKGAHRSKKETETLEFTKPPCLHID